MRMQKFALMQLLWDFREGDPAGCRLFHYQGGEVSHYMGFDRNGNMVFHRMVNQAAAGYDEEVKEMLKPASFSRVSSDCSFRLVPKVFRHAELPEIGEGFTCRNAGEEWLLCSNAGESIPLALPFFRKAQVRSRSFARYVLIHVQDEQVMVAAFNHGKPLLLNIFPASNEAEALYFATAPFKKAGLDTSGTRMEIMAEEHASHTLLQLFRRFIHDAAYCPAELPYSLEQLPPRADIASLLYTLNQCELQEV